MRIPAKFTESDIRDAHDAADVVASERFRPYLTGRLLPLLVARFRDEAAEALGIQLPPLPQRTSVRPARLDDLTSGELAALWGAVDVLVERFAACMDDPELPKLLRGLRVALVIEKADRARIADELRVKAGTS